MLQCHLLYPTVQGSSFTLSLCHVTPCNIVSTFGGSRLIYLEIMLISLTFSVLNFACLSHFNRLQYGLTHLPKSYVSILVGFHVHFLSLWRWSVVKYRPQLCSNQQTSGNQVRIQVFLESFECLWTLFIEAYCKYYGVSINHMGYRIHILKEWAGSKYVAHKTACVLLADVFRS